MYFYRRAREIMFLTIRILTKRIVLTNKLAYIWPIINSTNLILLLIITS